MQDEVTITVPDNVQYTYLLSGMTCPSCMGFETPVQVNGGAGVELEHALYYRAKPCGEEAFEGWHEYICLGCNYHFLAPPEDDDDYRLPRLADLLLAAQGRARP